MRIFIADSNKEFRLAVQLLTSQQSGLNITGMAIRTDRLAEQLIASRADLLLVNWDLPGQNLAVILTYLRFRLPDLKVVVTSVRPEAERVALEAGADAFVAANVSSDNLLKTLRSVHQTDIV